MFLDEGGGQVPWYVADGTNAFWHPKASVYPFGVGAGTVTASQSIFADKTALVGRNKQGAKIGIELMAGPTGSALVIRADVYQHDETTLITSQIISNGLVPLEPPPGPIQIPAAVHGSSAGATTGGFCIKLIDVATGASPAAATWLARVYYLTESVLGG